MDGTTPTVNTPRTISTNTAAHYFWGQGCDGWHLVGNAQLSVIEEQMPAGAKEAQHYHKATRQFFYVMHGTLTMVVGEGSTPVVAGSGIEIAPGTIHQARNDSDSNVRFLVISQPPSHMDRYEANGILP